MSGFNRKLWTIFVTSVTTAENPLPEDIKNTFERLGIPEAERKFLAGVGASLIPWRPSHG